MRIVVATIVNLNNVTWKVVPWDCTHRLSTEIELPLRSQGRYPFVVSGKSLLPDFAGSKYKMPTLKLDYRHSSAGQ
jgi:hypothetical protein